MVEQGRRTATAAGEPQIDDGLYALLIVGTRVAAEAPAAGLDVIL